MNLLLGEWPEGKGGDREQSRDRVLETESRAGWTRGDGVGDLFLICFIRG